jgi:anti-anti-sigma regulatory factor
MPDESAANKLRLRNRGGVPVIELVGDLNGAAIAGLESCMRSLAAAGHYNIVLNLQKAANANLKALTSLSKTIAQIRSHYGSVDLVAETGQLRELLRLENLTGLFRFNSSEAQAITKIKRLLHFPDEPAAGTSARLTE